MPPSESVGETSTPPGVFSLLPDDDWQLLVNTYTTSYQDSPSVAANGAGNFVVVWSSNGSAGSDASKRSIQGQRFASRSSSAGQLVPTRTLLVKNPQIGPRRLLWKVREAASAAVILGDPTTDGATLHVVLTPGGDQCFTMPSSNWTTRGALGFRYRDATLENGLVKSAEIKKSPSGTFVLKAVVVDSVILPGGPTTSYATNFTLGTGDEYCGGTAGAVPNPNNSTTFKVTNDAAPAACVLSCTPTTTSTSTSSSSSTSSTNTSTTSTTSTTITTPPGSCCNGDFFVSFSTTNAPGDCGDLLFATGALVANIQCSGLYTGGGGNSVPLPMAAPDQTHVVVSIAGCAGQSAIIGPADSAQTGSNTVCSDVGCYFGAPLPMPNSSTIPTSTCAVQAVQTAVSGSVDCSTGATNVNLPLTVSIFLTGDDLAGVPGIQPCPLCSAGSCMGGPNNGMACTAGTTAINAAYPTSHDCPPAPSDFVGNLPIAFALSSGTVTWRGTMATNDTGSTASAQTRVFSGYCRDNALPGGTGCFKGDPNPACPASTPGAQKCWENGMAVGAACGVSDTYESCEQRNQGAFGPNGAATRTILAIGNSMSILGGPSLGTLVSVFSIPPTFDATIDGANDLPGPGALAAPGTLETCAMANPCP